MGEVWRKIGLFWPDSVPPNQLLAIITFASGNQKGDYSFIQPVFTAVNVCRNAASQDQHTKYPRMKQFFLVFLVSALMISALSAQNTVEHRPGEMIVQLIKGVSPLDYMAKLNRLTGGGAGIYLKRTIIADWNIYLIGFDASFANPTRLIDESIQMSDVQFAQWNNIAEERSLTPNDPDWLQQADMSLINAPEAWATSTGGVTFNGDTIVVAVLEKGALLTHPDLVPNRWWNRQEIPTDGIDNDGNGYIDDFGGWNPSTGLDDTGSNGWHGTGVYGIIGAAGTNNLGVTGINWHVKMMNVSGVEDDVNILDAYYYVYTMRKLYNDTKGAKGAFIVATNASFGYDNQFPSATLNFTTWCSLYDSLGRVGVLNVGATTNQNTNVDLYGDMPTSCPSEYLIAVTEINTLGTHLPSGYGRVSIDLGAPGTGTYTTINTGNDVPGYSFQLGGTSAATPHVTGSVALLYSLGCEGFAGDAITDPAACARRVRDAILDNTQPNPTLDSITVTGGHLDLKKAVEGVTNICKGAVGRLQILQLRTFVEGQEVRMFYQTPIFLPYQFRVVNMLGQEIYQETLYPKQFNENYVKYDFSNLPRGVYVLSISRGNAIVSVKFPKI